MLSYLYQVLLQYVWGVLFICGFVLLVAVALFLRRVPDFYRSFRAADWPLIQGRIETADVVGFARQYLIRLGYSYSVGGVIFSGFVTQQFGDEQHALDYVDQVKGQAILVRYHPRKPEASAARSADQNTLSMSSRKTFLSQLLGSDLIELITGLNREAFKSSLSWPTVRGRVESHRVSQKREAGVWYMIPTYTAEVGYSYAVEGHYYAGSLSKTFFRENSALQFVEEMQGQEVTVRYSPGSPGISRLRREDQAGVVFA
jgi:hypothetical protein